MRHDRPDCARADCAIPNRHKDDCEHQYDENARCRGCLPALALDGLLLCGRDTDRIRTDALKLANLDAALLRVLAGRSGPAGEHVTTSGHDPNMSLNFAAVDTRAAIRATLRSLARLIVTERGFSQPRDEIADYGALVAKSYQWLAGNEKAGQHSATLAELAHSAYGVAYPSGTRQFPIRTGRDIAACPELVAGDGGEQVPCPGTLWTMLRVDDLLPSEIACNGPTCHIWTTRQWMRLGLRLQRAGTTSTGR